MTAILTPERMSQLETDLAQHIYEFMCKHVADMEDLDLGFDAFKQFEYQAERRANTLLRQYVEIYNDHVA